MFSKRLKWLIGIAGALAISVPFFAMAQIGGGVGQITLFKKIGNAILPISTSYDIGSSSTRIANGYFTNLDTTNLAVGGAVSGSLTVGGGITSGTTGSLLGSLALKGSTSGVVTLQPAVVAGTWSLTLPTDDGTVGQFLKTDGNGITSWDTAGGVFARTTTKTVCASDSLDVTNCDYKADGTADEVQINDAIAAVAALPNGGKVLLLDGTFTINATITLSSNVVLSGVGVGTKITSSQAIRFITASSQSNWEVSNLYLLGATGTKDGIYFASSATSFVIRNVKINGMRYSGITTNSANRGLITDNEIYSSSQYGIEMNSAVNTIVSNNIIRNNTRSGILVSGASDYNSIEGNILLSNGYYGIEDSTQSDFTNIVGNTISQGTNGYDAILVSGAQNVSIIGNYIYDVGASYSGIKIAGSITNPANKTFISSNVFGGLSYQGYIINDSSEYDVDTFITGNSFSKALEVNGGKLYQNNLGTKTIISNNIGSDAVYEQSARRMKNTSGGALAAGDVVVLKAVAAGNEVTTTTTGGDSKVYGIAVEAIADNAFGMFQTLGKTTLLKVDGTTDIAIGDFISTFTTAKIAKKAGAGETTFAIALEAYATDDSSGVIDALIITPRTAP